MPLGIVVYSISAKKNLALRAMPFRIVTIVVYSISQNPGGGVRTETLTEKSNAYALMAPPPLLLAVLAEIRRDH